MGQYYYLCCPPLKQYLRPHAFGDGAKALEFGASGSGAMLGLAALLLDGNGRGGGDLRSDDPIVGSWAGHAIVIAGDYADPGKHVPEEDLVRYRKHMSQDADYVKCMREKGAAIGDEVPNLYTLACALYEDVSDAVILALCDDPYERKALVERGAEAAKNWKPPAPPVPEGDPFVLD